MSTKLCILCPGQGAQAVTMGKDFFESSPAARATFESANKILGFDLASICFNGPEERLNQTDISQPAIYTTSIAAYRAAAEKNILSSETPSIYAGLSLGEYTALHFAGVFSFEDGLKLVAARGRYMQDAATASPSGMVAIMGADEVTVTQLCEDSVVRRSRPRRNPCPRQLQRPRADRRLRLHRGLCPRHPPRRIQGLQGHPPEGRRCLPQPPDAARRRQNASRVGESRI
jgi:[acyl-carrier-protein] S-malonyltransferase